MPCLLESSSSLERPWSARHVHAPRADGTFVAVPPLAEAAAIAQRNRECLAAARTDLQGRDLASIRAWARREVVDAARRYTKELLSGEVPTQPSCDGGGQAGNGLAGDQDSCAASVDVVDTTLFVGGHQPTLFHPGVWVKNFVVGHLAKNDRGLGLNLVVDTDTLSGTSVRVPTGHLAAPGVAAIPFDEPRPRQPWEEARVIDRPLFSSLADRVLAALGDFGVTPLVGEFWPAAVRRLARSDSLAECLTAARSVWERRWGVANLELPVSRLCALEPFLWFAAHLLKVHSASVLRFVYNETLREYRAGQSRSQSRTHPCPTCVNVTAGSKRPFVCGARATRCAGPSSPGRRGRGSAFGRPERICHASLDARKRRLLRRSGIAEARGAGNSVSYARADHDSVHADVFRRRVCARHRRREIRPDDRSNHGPVLRTKGPRVLDAVGDTAPG